MIQQAVALHQQGRLDEAEQLYLRILQDCGDHFDALHLLGVLMHQRGRSEQALALIAKAVATNARSADAHANQGRVLAALRRPQEALASFNLSLALNAEQSDVLLQCGNVLQQLNRPTEALENLDRALALRPQFPEALHNRGVILQALERHEEALASYDRALALLPGDATLLNSRGATLGELGRLEEALASYDQALAVQPDYVDALYNRGNILKRLDRLDEAVASYDRTLTLHPDYAEAHYNRGNALHGLGRFDEAMTAYDRALALRADHADVLTNRGLTLQELARFDEALASYARSLAARPDNAEAYWNDALLRLLLGDFERGWAEYEWRWHKESMSHARRDFRQPLWLGEEALAGKTILLHAEQGFGDAIQSCRYLPLVAARGARVILEVPASLRELMTSLDGATEVIAKGKPLPDTDFHCPLFSLPFACGTRLTTIPAAVPYLRAPAQRLADWQAKLATKRRPLIGLAWSGNPAHKNDRNRSIALRALLPLLDSGATFVSLQKDVLAGDAAVLKMRRDLLDYGDALGDFADTAALIAQLDLVISVDTSVAHLAGALGKPVWVLLPHVPDFRWLLGRGDSPWYPSARLFRQDATRRWDGVIARLRAALADFAESR